ncbi:MAG: hypothetical protein ACHRXM_23480 [Isosphaerales bacterium]
MSIRLAFTFAGSLALNLALAVMGRGSFGQFSFTDPSGMFNGVEFDSRSGFWHEWH